MAKPNPQKRAFDPNAPLVFPVEKLKPVMKRTPTPPTPPPEEDGVFDFTFDKTFS